MGHLIMGKFWAPNLGHIWVAGGGGGGHRSLGTFESLYVGQGYSSCKSSSSQTCQCFHVHIQWHGFQCLGSLTCVQTLRHAVVHGGCMNTVRESAWKLDSSKKHSQHQGIEPVSVLQLPFCPNTLLTELSLFRGCVLVMLEWSKNGYLCYCLRSSFARILCA